MSLHVMSRYVSLYQVKLCQLDRVGTYGVPNVEGDFAFDYTQSCATAVSAEARLSRKNVAPASLLYPVKFITMRSGDAIVNRGNCMCSRGAERGWYT